jgi:hypothetical protein
LLDKEFLQITDNQFSELSFISQGIESVTSVITKVWQNDKFNKEVKTAQADWVLENIYTGNLGCSHLWKKTTDEVTLFHQINALASDICNLLIRGLMLDDNLIGSSKNTKLSHFSEWLTERIITTRCISSPEILKAIARQVENRFKVSQAQNYQTPEEKFYAGVFLGKFFLHLPEVIAKEIRLDQETSNWLRIKVGNTITMPGANFEADDYWKAIERSISGEKIALKATDSETEYFMMLEQVKGDTKQLFPTVKVTDLEGNLIDKIQDPSFGIFASDQQTRLDVIHKLRSWFDCDQKEFEKQANEISQITDSIDRVTRFYKVRETSMFFYYSNLEENFRKGTLLTWQELMPPSAERLSGFFRLPPLTNGKDFSEIWAEAAYSLINEEELPVAISRIASLPVKMPETVIERFLQLPDNEKVEFLQKLSPGWISPIQLLHLTNLAARSLPSENKMISEIAKGLLNRLYQLREEDDIFAAFHATLSFVKSEFYFWDESSKLLPETALAVMWGHATRLYNIQRAVGIEPKNIVSSLNNRRESYFFESLARNQEFWNDCVYPRRVSRTDFLTHAAAKIFAGIDETILQSLTIPELIRKEVFRQNDETGALIPSTRLLFDPVLCDDKLKSLFGGDRFEALLPIIGAENTEILKSDNLIQSAKTLLERVAEDPKESKNWTLFYAIVMDLPIYSDLRELCFNALKNLSQNSFLQEDVENPGFIFFAGASQVANFGDEKLRKDFRKTIVEIFSKLEVNDNLKDNLEVRATLLDAALCLSYLPDDSEKSNKEFAEIIEKISHQWQDFVIKFGHPFTNTFWNIPLVDGESWRHLNLLFRATKIYEN